MEFQIFCSLASLGPTSTILVATFRVSLITWSFLTANGGRDSVSLFYFNKCVFIPNNLLFFFKLSGGTSQCRWINFYMTPSISLRFVVFNVLNPVNLYDVSKQNDCGEYFLEYFVIKHFKLRFQWMQLFHLHSPRPLFSSLQRSQQELRHRGFVYPQCPRLATTTSTGQQKTALRRSLKTHSPSWRKCCC